MKFVAAIIVSAFFTQVVFAQNSQAEIHSESPRLHTLRCTIGKEYFSYNRAMDKIQITQPGQEKKNLAIQTITPTENFNSIRIVATEDSQHTGNLITVIDISTPGNLLKGSHFATTVSDYMGAPGASLNDLESSDSSWMPDRLRKGDCSIIINE